MQKTFLTSRSWGSWSLRSWPTRFTCVLVWLLQFTGFFWETNLKHSICFWIKLSTWLLCRQEDRHNKIQHVVTSFDKYASDKDLGEGVIPINQDCNIFVSEADPGVEQEYVLSADRQLYMVCIEGQLNASDLVQLETRDAVEVRTPWNSRLLFCSTYICYQFWVKFVP